MKVAALAKSSGSSVIGRDVFGGSHLQCVPIFESVDSF